MARRGLSVEDRLRAIISTLDPEMDVDLEVEFVAEDSGGALVWRRGPAPAVEDDDGDDDDDDGSPVENSEEPDDDAEPEVEHTPAVERRRVRVEQRPEPSRTRNGQSRDTSPRSADPVLDASSPDYDWQADIDQWVAAGGAPPAS